MIFGILHSTIEVGKVAKAIKRNKWDIFIFCIQQHQVPLTPFARNGLLSIYLLTRIVKNTPLN